MTDDKDTKDPGGRPTLLTGRWLKLANAYGGVIALAKECGVSRSTIARWASGEQTPHKLVQESVDGLAHQRGLAGPFGTSGKSKEVAGG